MVVTHPVEVEGIRGEAGVLSVLDPGTGVITTTAVVKFNAADGPRINEKFSDTSEFFVRAIKAIPKKED